MKKGAVVIGVIVVIATAAGVGYAKNWWGPGGATAQAPSPVAPKAVAIEVAKAVQKTTPVIIEALGTVTPIASVAIRSRVDTEIVRVHFADGARVKAGDVLLTLDCRSIEAQMLQVEGNVARDKAQLEGAERDLKRYTELVAKSATPITNLDNAKTQAAVFAAAMKADEAALQNLKVQQSYCTIRAPIAGRISSASVKVGNFVRSADILPIATLIQTRPIYITFPLPQDSLPALRHALAAESATVEAVIPGEAAPAGGAVTMIENTVDPATGMVMARATMPNESEVLWPGSLLTTKLTVREEKAITVPAAAVQISQSGTFVFVVKNDTVTVVPVKVVRTVGGDSVLASGVEDGDTIVTDGHLQLTNGSRVTIRQPKAGT